MIRVTTHNDKVSCVATGDQHERNVAPSYRTFNSKQLAKASELEVRTLVIGDPTSFMELIYTARDQAAESVRQPSNDGSDDYHAMNLREESHIIEPPPTDEWTSLCTEGGAYSSQEMMIKHEGPHRDNR